MADINKLTTALERAHAAGDADAAKSFASAIKGLRAQEATLGHKVGAVIDGVAQGLTFGYSDEIAAGLGSGFGLVGDYDKSRRIRKSLPRTANVSNIVPVDGAA